MLSRSPRIAWLTGKLGQVRVSTMHAAGVVLRGAVISAAPNRDQV